MQRQNPAITVSTDLENQAIKYSDVQKTWGMVTLRASDLIPPNNNLPVDFVFLIDISASMRVDSKLAFVQATIEYLLSKLTAKQTLSLVTFNHEVRTLTSLMPCTSENKKHIVELVKNLEALGSTNISEALFTGTSILARRESVERSSIGSLMLFTDGLSNQGLSTDATLQSLKQVTLPPGCIFNTFGLGVDHDSSLLQNIALSAQGVYYYVETKEDIPSTFGECVAGILSTRAHHIKLQLRCNDGARLVTIATPFKITEQRVAKDYDIDLELMYGGETKSIIFRVSLRAMNQPMNFHSILDVKLEYINTVTGKKELSSVPISIVRPAMPTLEKIPIPLDQHINRYSAATTISEAVALAKQFNFVEAQHKLKSLIQKIKKSASGPEPYCEDLMKDLQECIQGMTDSSAFQAGIHAAHAYSSMYFMERSAGLKNRSRHRPGSFVRHVSYGYATAIQECEAQNATDQTRVYLSSYCDCKA